MLIVNDLFKQAEDFIVFCAAAWLLSCIRAADGLGSRDMTLLPAVKATSSQIKGHIRQVEIIITHLFIHLCLINMQSCFYHNIVVF